ncbi:NAD(P)/FAD-dependent oxidoreductase [Acidianus brierleyi]|uniref:Pyridine nucleotide-disulfide oxidoreductase n=1 Tax=Acidianus brierleyi TaxID=41673 RepID=A0A2U9IDP9_9CREN|nr:FAD-dependent oxidoreductase [Acidianus brierleyi]AWR94120.1 pyridine nucleotide-disulfide oxidoreductase [Acidianus brierleyi]
MRTVILGGGFAGVSAFLNNTNSIVIDNKDYFVLTHKLVDVIETGDPSIAEIKYPDRFLKAYIRNVDFKKKKIITDRGEIDYDKLIISLGYEQDLSKIRGNVYKLENVEDAIKIRQQLSKVNSVAILGGGTLGVELAGTLNSMGKKVYLIEAQQKLLSFMSKDASAFALDTLKDLGVNVLLNTKVYDVKNTVETSSGEIKVDLTILTAGFKGPSIISEIGLSNINGRMLVDEYLKSIDYDDVYGAGDCMTIKNSFVPMSAQVAVQSGETAMLNVLGKDTKFKYKQIAIILRIGNIYFGDIFGKFVKGKMAELAKNIGIYRSIRMVQKASLI